ncbi:MAG: hypothetical protein VYE73_15865 [Acidobacteriota bacterium]|nr:hypothetical protein [Acidobacteriota bacterium]
MRNGFRGTLVPTVVTLTLLLVAAAAFGQDYEAPRTPDGKPDLNGIWQALGSAHNDIEGHAARMGPIVELGALGAIPGGLGIVDGGKIPYQDWARDKQQENLADWHKLDPAVKCFMPGIPRANYLPFPFQIVQTPEYILIAYEFASASRVVYMERPDFESPFDTWMGHSRGHWEGDTLVVDVTSQVPDTWLDSSGNHHSDQIRVEERYTRVSPGHIQYEATITDPQTYTRPWKLSFPLYRRVEENMQLLEFKFVEFAEELMYGHLRKGAEPAE